VREGGGTIVSIRSIAASMKTPVGSPDASRMIFPPAGSGVAAVMRAARIAAVLASPAWPSMRRTQTGRSPTTRSSAAARGNSFTVQSFWSHPRPWIHSPGGAPSAPIRIRSITSS
jgi:hypothetical protein